MHATFVAARTRASASRTRSPASGRSTSRRRSRFLLGIPGPQNARGKILYDLFTNPGQLKEIDDPRHQRLPRPARPALRGGRQRSPAPARQPDLRDRRLGVPEAVVRRLPRRGAERLDHGRGGRLGRRDAADLAPSSATRPTIELMNLMGFGARRPRQPQLRQGPGVPAQHADPAGELPVPLVERRRRQRQDAGGVEAVEGVRHVRRRQGRPRRLHERRRSDARLPGGARPVPRRELDGIGGQRRGGEAEGAGNQHDRRDRPPRGDGRDAHATRPGRSSTSPTTSRTSTP